MTFNIHHGKGMDKQTNLYRIAEVIDRCHADIVGLNEVDNHFSNRSHFEDQAAWLANQLKLEYAFSPSISIQSQHVTEVRQYGNALLSRFPITCKKSHSLNTLYGGLEGRSLLDATIQVHKQSFQINVTHLSLNPILHRRQTDFIISQLDKKFEPIILMGDWNMKPLSKGWRKVTNKFQDVWHIAGEGPGYTYPSLHPRSRLDYIFTSRDFKVTEAKVVTNIPNASDHLPVTATLHYKY